MMDPTFQGAIILATFFLAVACAGFTANVASSKGWDGPSWFLGGFLFGPLALLAAVGMPDKNLQNNLRALIEKFSTTKITFPILRD